MATRAKRFQDAVDKVSEVKSYFEELRDELQSWLDNMPENLQGGAKADELEDAIYELDSVVSSLEDVEGTSVNFPSMR